MRAQKSGAAHKKQREAHRYFRLIDAAHSPKGIALPGTPAPEAPTYGALAQLVERYTGSVEVRGSTPLGSTIFTNICEIPVERPRSVNPRFGLFENLASQSSEQVMNWQRPDRRLNNQVRFRRA